MSTVGSRLKEAREASNVSQEELARKFDMSRVAIAQWESDTTSPSIKHISQAAELLKEKPEWLAFGIV